MLSFSLPCILKERLSEKSNPTFFKKLKTNKFERCFEPEEETFRGKATGNLVLNKNCTFCDFKKACWEILIEAPAVMSKAQFPKIVSYVELNKENVI